MWVELLQKYSGFLQLYLPIIMCFSAKLSCKSLINAFILLKNLVLALVNIEIMNKKLFKNLAIYCIVKVKCLALLFISCSLS